MQISKRGDIKTKGGELPFRRAWGQACLSVELTGDKLAAPGLSNQGNLSFRSLFPNLGSPMLCLQRLRLNFECSALASPRGRWAKRVRLWSPQFWRVGVVGTKPPSSPGEPVYVCVRVQPFRLHLDTRPAS